mmetsp:Transcript_11559/g.25301  ORF Transcript_11559/g.25301 Transcript_11559/m.25301 type:complete len:292 (-) Transcript_11559:515-1390(-)
MSHERYVDDVSVKERLAEESSEEAIVGELIDSFLLVQPDEPWGIADLHAHLVDCGVSPEPEVRVEDVLGHLGVELLGNATAVDSFFTFELHLPVAVQVHGRDAQHGFAGVFKEVIAIDLNFDVSLGPGDAELLAILAEPDHFLFVGQGLGFSEHVIVGNLDALVGFNGGGHAALVGGDQGELSLQILDFGRYQFCRDLTHEGRLLGVKRGRHVFFFVFFFVIFLRLVRAVDPLERHVLPYRAAPSFLVVAQFDGPEVRLPDRLGQLEADGLSPAGVGGTGDFEASSVGHDG